LKNIARFGAAAGSVCDVDVLERGSLFGDSGNCCAGLAAIVEVEDEGFACDIGHLHIIYMYILNDTTATASRFETEADVCADEYAVANGDVFSAA